eukprot:TRINITY_DN73100_c0_g1_i1.p1 TRINITY_DN73100_c0_g1~~TRINITY_DN73100_c0_g1_i1.p1  ORF type:complete len:234 (+),score=45.44 TRINITY_DN73100_c0_g1_i1:39-704(+)
MSFLRSRSRSRSEKRPARADCAGASYVASHASRADVSQELQLEPLSTSLRTAATGTGSQEPTRCLQQSKALEEASAASLETAAVNEYCQSALILASADRGNSRAVEKLLAARADVSDVDARGASALTWASAFSGDPKIVRALLSAQADVAHSDEDGLTPLMAASQNGHLEIVRILLDARAEPDGGGASLGSRAGSAIALAQEGGHDDVVTVLLAAASGANA